MPSHRRLTDYGATWCPQSPAVDWLWSYMMSTVTGGWLTMELHDVHSHRRLTDYGATWCPQSPAVDWLWSYMMSTVTGGWLTMELHDVHSHRRLTDRTNRTLPPKQIITTNWVRFHSCQIIYVYQKIRVVLKLSPEVHHTLFLEWNIWLNILAKFI